MQLPFPEPEEPPSLESNLSHQNPGGPSGARTFNYFNYFTEIEEAFVARRGSPMMISPLDWALVESWKSQEIPLYIVLRGITQAFDKRGHQPQTPQLAHKKVNTLFYCQQAVMTEFAEYRETQVGASSSGANGAAQAEHTTTAGMDLFPPGSVKRYLQEVTSDLEQSHQAALLYASEMYPHTRWQEALERTIQQIHEITETLPDGGEGQDSAPINFEKLEQDLTRLEELLYEALCADISPEVASEILAEAATQLKPHKKRMDTAVYQQTLENYKARQLRARYRVPRLSLFYLRPE